MTLRNFLSPECGEKLQRKVPLFLEIPELRSIQHSEGQLLRAGSWSFHALRLESDCGPGPRTYIYIQQCFFGKCKRLHTYLNVHLYQVKRTHCRLRHQIPRILKDQKRPQIFSLEISGPKVVLVLLCKFSFNRCTGRSGPRGFSLTSLLDDPALQLLRRKQT